MVAVEDQEDIIKENAKDKKKKSSKYCSLMYQGASDVHEDIIHLASRQQPQHPTP